ncbi:Eco57I restriction-modification methylase domain-containing protein [Mucilaginibacter antarcticus]|uniref:site-specific DNA-methyltransferase (adenine-specific) n=1 Tax=Mucilaginibacter antarcticus TaxID=1855725 RepID=A0ABW5XQG9_9SPHI
MLNSEQLKPILENSYNRNDWYKILRQNFNVNVLRENPPPIVSVAGNEFNATAYELGDFNTTEGHKVGIYEVAVPGVKQIYRNKVGLRNLLKNVYQTDVDAALIVFTQGDKWRFSYVSEVTTRNPETGLRESTKTDPKRYTYLFGKNEKAKTAADRFADIKRADASTGQGITLKGLQDTFNVEKMSKEFFDKYRKHYGAFLSYLIGENEEGKASGVAAEQFKTIFNADDKKARDFVKKMLGRIVFLYFLEKKGWLGVPEHESWGKGDPDFLRNLFDKSKDQEGFYPLVLEPLFHNTLNQVRDGDFFAIDNTLFNGIEYNKYKIPFLNGGLFEPEAYNTDFLIFPAELFKNLFAFFDRYNFTVHEDSPQEHTVAVDPEMLGHIFENLLEDNKDKGAFYTPKEIVHYMCQESLIEYLCTKCEAESDENLRAGIEGFIKNQELGGIAEYDEIILQALRDVKICDPAIGSGAFPMGVLLEIFHSVETLYYEFDATKRIWDLEDGWNPAKVKLSIIENSIYGVDIEPGAVDIARLRFWLSLVVDEVKPQPLPNLDYKIMQGNSLLESFEDIDLCVKVGEEENSLFRDETKFSLSDITKLKTQVKKYFKADTPTKKATLQASINQVINKFISERIAEKQKRNDEATNDASNSLVLESRRSPTSEALKIKQQGNLKKLRSTLEKLIKDGEHIRELQNELLLMRQSKVYPYFLWHLWFSDVFDDGGFDIVIGNPPYIQLQSMKKQTDLLQAAGYETFSRTGDIYCLFYEVGFELLKTEGILTYITSNKWMRSAYGERLKDYFLRETNPLLLLDFGGYQVFETATVDTNILVSQKAIYSGRTNTCVLNKSLKSLNKMSDFIRQNINETYLDSGSWAVLNSIETAIKKKMETIGVPLKDWDINIYRGILTGYNEAFIIDEKTKNEIISKSKSADLSEIIRPILRGRDVQIPSRMG